MSDLITPRDSELLRHTDISGLFASKPPQEKGYAATYEYEPFNDETSFYAGLVEAGAADPQRSLDHERAHLETAKAVGIVSARYLIKRDRGSGRFEGATVYVGDFRDVPRLAYASVAVAPIDPSPSDRDMLVRIGYFYFAVLDEKIRAWNDTNELQIPLPGSLDRRSQ